MRGGLVLLMALVIVGCKEQSPQQPVANATIGPIASPTQKADTAPSDGDGGWLQNLNEQQSVAFIPARSSRETYSFSSSVGDTRFIPVDELPVVKRLPVNHTFEQPLTPTSAAGRLAQARGWAVLGETRMGGLTVIGIARGWAYVAGRFDYLIDGNIAIFQGTRLLAVLHRDAADKMGIGFLQPLENDAFRVYASLPVAPMGDLELSGHRLHFGPLARVDRWCGGRVEVPNIYGQPIKRARAMLTASGWAPRNVKFAGFDADHEQFAAEGIGEAEYCVQDSISQCHFHYAAAGARLEVQTGDPRDLPGGDHIPDGDDLHKPVFFYDVECRAHGRRGR